ncbi:hypothetical protein EGI22_04530 [Lacihabitans sp. LS3-19]|uniref:tetratricopeptide repeat protein n=1 Tax=Lacihabitans sp. LS3-19 TaxID=2487335 RepID=UPI0020CE9A57|nr:tetratricopeptide repeat protein [Lacihabitans sp. LS3-19]MCP9767164.1 hypothetical protein [Lacihabitans sp. LS3-19]
MKYRLFLFFYAISISLTFCQKVNKIDSLKSAFQTLKPSKEKAQLSLDIVQYYSRNNNDSNAKYLEVSKIAVWQYGDKRMQARNKLDFANHLRNLGKFDESIKINQEAIKSYESIGDFQGMGAGYNSLGMSFKVLGNDKVELQSYVEKALKYSILSKEYYEKANDNDGLLRIYSNIGTMYRDLKRFSDAEQSYLDGLAIAKKTGMDNYSVGVLYSNLGQIYMDAYKDYDKSIFYLNKALANYQKNEIYNYQEHVFRNLAFNYTKKGDFLLAIDYAKKALAIAEKSHDPQQKINSYAALIYAQQKAGLHKEAFENLTFQKNVEDSVLSVEKTSIIAEMDAKFEAVQKEAKIQVLSKTNELNKWRIVALLLTLLALVYYYYSLLQKRKKDKLLFEQEQRIESEKRKNAEIELDAKKKELTAKVLQLARKNEFLNSLETEIDYLKNNVDDSVNKTTNRISRMIKRDIDSDVQWDQFSQEFSSVHQGFLSALTEKFGNFSKSEIRLISLLKMNMNSKEIADILGISDEGIKKARYRLRQKMNLEDAELQSFLLSFG